MIIRVYSWPWGARGSGTGSVSPCCPVRAVEEALFRPLTPSTLSTVSRNNVKENGRLEGCAYE